MQGILNLVQLPRDSMQEKNKRKKEMNSTNRFRTQQRLLQNSRRRSSTLEKNNYRSSQRLEKIKYIAELIYGDSTQSIIEDAVRWVIIIIVFVFDPLAVLLLISANITLKEERKRRRTKTTRSRRKKQKEDETAWERKLKEIKRNKGGLTKVVHENNGMKAEYYE